jgi:hypothetical protein
MPDKGVTCDCERCGSDDVSIFPWTLLLVREMCYVMAGNRQAKLLSLFRSNTEIERKPCIQAKVQGRTTVDADIDAM